MTRIYSYILRIDDGAAPNPFGRLCTLTICKPVIRRKANVGDWVIGTGSKRVKQKDKSEVDFSDSLVYAMKITDKKTLKEYDEFCKNELQNKIPDWHSSNGTARLGDCIYDYSNGDTPIMRAGVHNEINRDRDTNGLNSLLSDHFYYFGLDARPIPQHLQVLIKRNQGHKKIENTELVEAFEKWISQFDLNRLYADPQLKWRFDNEEVFKDYCSLCASERAEDPTDDGEEVLC